MFWADAEDVGGAERRNEGSEGRMGLCWGSDDCWNEEGGMQVESTRNSFSLLQSRSALLLGHRRLCIHNSTISCIPSPYRPYPWLSGLGE